MILTWIPHRDQQAPWLGLLTGTGAVLGPLATVTVTALLAPFWPAADTFNHGHLLAHLAG
jgi:hypothetical protein